MMKNKNKKKKILFILIPIIIAVIIIFIATSINKKNDKNGVFSVLEKRWIEKNQSKVIDVSVINDLPIFGEDGEGVFFDFLNDFTKENKIEFNMLPYSLEKTPTSKEYSFETSKKSKVSSNELLFYSDNYVLISKDNNKVKNFSDLKNTTIGALESDLNMIKSYLSDDENVIFNSYVDINSIIKAINNNDILYAVVPKNLYIDQIFENNYYIVYDIPEITTNYIFKVNGDNSVLNSILKKYYIRWSKNKLDKSYNDRLFDLYFDKKKIDDVTKADFLSKEYTYGFVKNLPYESKVNDQFIGYNSEILDEFAKRMGISFKVKEYGSVKALTKALNDGKVDVAFNYYNYSDLDKKNFDSTFSPYQEKVVVLTSNNNIETSVSSLKGLKGMDVIMIDDKISNYLKNRLEVSIKTYRNAKSLFNNMNDNSVVVLDYNLYNYYRNTDLKDYKIIYEEDIDTEYNFITLNTNRNKAFNGLFKYYISTLDSGLYQARAYVKLQSDNKLVDMKYIYVLILTFVIIFVLALYFKKEKSINTIKKSEKIKYVDHLTSLKNRNYLNQNYQKWQNNKIYPQAIIIIELNKIGHINDVYGHEEGDMVIKKAANILINNQLEQSDIVRTNGDEFLIYMVGYEETKVIAYMRKLYKEFKTLPYNFGVLLGYSMIQDDIKTIDDAMNEAVLEIKTSKEMNNNE